MGKKIDNLKENVTDYLYDHGEVIVAIGYGVGLLVAIPLCYACYKWQAKLIGKEVAKHLK